MNNPVEEMDSACRQTILDNHSWMQEWVDRRSLEPHVFGDILEQVPKESIPESLDFLQDGMWCRSCLWKRTNSATLMGKTASSQKQERWISMLVECPVKRILGLIWTGSLWKEKRGQCTWSGPNRTGEKKLHFLSSRILRNLCFNFIRSIFSCSFHIEDSLMMAMLVMITAIYTLLKKSITSETLKICEMDDNLSVALLYHFIIATFQGFRSLPGILHS